MSRAGTCRTNIPTSPPLANVKKKKKSPAENWKDCKYEHQPAPNWSSSNLRQKKYYHLFKNILADGRCLATARPQLGQWDTGLGWHFLVQYLPSSCVQLYLSLLQICLVSHPLNACFKRGNINQEWWSVLLLLQEKKNFTQERCWGNCSYFTSLLKRKNRYIYIKVKFLGENFPGEHLVSNENSKNLGLNEWSLQLYPHCKLKSS